MLNQNPTAKAGRSVNRESGAVVEKAKLALFVKGCSALAKDCA